MSWLTYQASGGDAIRIVGRGITGLTPFGEMVMGGYSPIILMLATLGLVFFISFRINRLQYTTALGLFMLYAALLGAALSTIFVQSTPEPRSRRCSSSRRPRSVRSAFMATPRSAICRRSAHS